ncbi:MAG: glycoside hydrolase family 3 N-terminal domain-containing protein [Bacteroidota bacterium]
MSSISSGRLALLLVAVTLPLLAAGCYKAEGKAHADRDTSAVQVAMSHVVLSDSLLAPFEGFKPPPGASEDEATRWADSVLATLTLDQKIGQLFIVDLRADWIRGARSLEQVAGWGVGGFHVGRRVPPRTVLQRTNRVQNAADVPLFITADFEWGVGQPSTAFTELPGAMAYGAAGDPMLAELGGAVTAMEARAMGVNVLFAPTADVNNNPRNPIINTRSYGEDPERVGELAGAFVRGAQAHGALATLKHFPGHGNTATDTHTDFDAVPGDWESLSRTELAPYRTALRSNPGFVMSAHLWMQALDEEPIPATFSRRALTDVLRDSLGYDGIVSTDAVVMGALKKNYPFRDRIVRPIQAGADIILNTTDPRAGMRAIRRAVDQGELPEARIDQSVLRILKGKARLGLHRQRVSDPDRLNRMLEEVRGARFADALTQAAVTVVRPGPLPLRPEQTVSLIQMSNFRAASPMTRLERDLRPDNQLRVGRSPSGSQTSRARRLARASDVVVLAVHLKVLHEQAPTLTASQRRFAQSLLDAGTPVVVAVIGNPYAATDLAAASGLVMAYDETARTATAVANVLTGRQPARGRLPVNVPGI